MIAVRLRALPEDQQVVPLDLVGELQDGIPLDEERPAADARLRGARGRLLHRARDARAGLQEELLVALPGVWLYNYFINRIDFISMEVTMATKEFMDFLLRYEARLTHSNRAEAATAAAFTARAS
mgnify:CR=1 FL=1